MVPYRKCSPIKEILQNQSATLCLQHVFQFLYLFFADEIPTEKISTRLLLHMNTPSDLPPQIKRVYPFLLLFCKGMPQTSFWTIFSKKSKAYKWEATKTKKIKGNKKITSQSFRECGLSLLLFNDVHPELMYLITQCMSTMDP